VQAKEPYKGRLSAQSRLAWAAWDVVPPTVFRVWSRAVSSVAGVSGYAQQEATLSRDRTLSIRNIARGNKTDLLERCAR